MKTNKLRQLDLFNFLHVIIIFNQKNLKSHSKAKVRKVSFVDMIHRKRTSYVLFFDASKK